MEKGEEQFHLFQDVFNGVLILKSFNSHVSVVLCSFFEFVTVSTWCIRELAKLGAAADFLPKDYFLPV